jgi:hypothetical protein
VWVLLENSVTKFEELVINSALMSGSVAPSESTVSGSNFKSEINEAREE